MEKRIQDELEILKGIIVDAVPVEQIFLFGSYAYGTPGEDSDFDLYIVIPDDSIRPLEAAQIINNVIYEDQRKPVDILVGRVSDFRRRSQLPTIERTIARDGVMLFGR